jgi:peptide/nickel transport system ATP-binding protein
VADDTHNSPSHGAGLVLDVRNLRVDAEAAVASRPLVADVRFSLSPGEVIGLIGESGAGKSTIGLAMLAYARAGCAITAGEILFRGKDLRTMPSKQLAELRGRRISYVAQSAAAAFNPAITIERQVCERLEHLGLQQARQRTLALFRELDLPDPEHFGRRYPHQVSGGQLQRAMAAMAMAAAPDLIVFDEPTTALDVTTQVEVLGAFRALIKAHGTAAVYISHDIAVVAQLADKIIVLRDGQIVEQGTTSDILFRPKQNYTRRLIAKRIPRLSQKSAQRSAPVLSISNLDASYATHRKVLADISVVIPRCSTLAIVGESGSGKSTLARVIAGLLSLESGEIRLNGVPLPTSYRKRTRDMLRRVQLIHQMPDVALNPKHTMLDVIGRPIRFYFGRGRRETRREVEALIERMDLPKAALERAVGKLSGGQKQRVCIARAIAAEPDLIICDEITASLDQLVAEDILVLLKELQAERGASYCFISHDIGTVRRFADDLIIMKAGRIADRGTIAEVFEPPLAAYTEKLLLSVPEPEPGWLDRALAARRTDATGQVELALQGVVSVTPLERQAI